MVNLQNNLPHRLTTGQKAFAGVLLLGAIWGAIKLINPFMADLKDLLQNFWWCVGLGVPAVFLVLYLINNPWVIWGLFTTISRKLTYFLVKMDPLSVMDRYVDYLKKKRANLGVTIEVLRGKKIKLDRIVSEKEANVQKNLALGKSAYGNEKTRNAAALYGVKVQTDKEALEMFRPMQERTDKSLTFLQELDDNWKYSTEKLEYQIAGKREQYEIIKETTKGLKTAEALINSDNEAARLYGMSVKALEESVTQKLGYIDEFERKSKDFRTNIAIEKQAVQDEGLKILEDYMNSEKLKLDFSDAETIPFEEVPGSLAAPKKYNLLKNKKS